MSRTPDVSRFYSKYWSYMAAVVKILALKEWNCGRPVKPPAGVMADLKRFVELALKGFGILKEEPRDYKCHDLAYHVMLIARRVGSFESEASVTELFKKLENFLCVLEHSAVPTVILDVCALTFFQKFFEELRDLGEQEEGDDD